MVCPLTSFAIAAKASRVRPLFRSRHLDGVTRRADHISSLLPSNTGEHRSYNVLGRPVNRPLGTDRPTDRVRACTCYIAFSPLDPLFLYRPPRAVPISTD